MQELVVGRVILGIISQVAMEVIVVLRPERTVHHHSLRAVTALRVTDKMHMDSNRHRRFMIQDMVGELHHLMEVMVDMVAAETRTDQPLVVL